MSFLYKRLITIIIALGISTQANAGVWSSCVSFMKSFVSKITSCYARPKKTEINVSITEDIPVDFNQYEDDLIYDKSTKEVPSQWYRVSTSMVSPYKIQRTIAKIKKDKENKRLSESYSAAPDDDANTILYYDVVTQKPTTVSYEDFISESKIFDLPERDVLSKNDKPRKKKSNITDEKNTCNMLETINNNIKIDTNELNGLFNNNLCKSLSEEQFKKAQKMLLAQRKPVSKLILSDSKIENYYQLQQLQNKELSIEDRVRIILYSLYTKNSEIKGSPVYDLTQRLCIEQLTELNKEYDNLPEPLKSPIEKYQNICSGQAKTEEDSIAMYGDMQRSGGKYLMSLRNK